MTKQEEEEDRRRRIAVKPKSADDYVGPPKYTRCAVPSASQITATAAVEMEVDMMSRGPYVPRAILTSRNLSGVRGIRMGNIFRLSQSTVKQRSNSFGPVSVSGVFTVFSATFSRSKI